MSESVSLRSLSRGPHPDAVTTFTPSRSWPGNGVRTGRWPPEGISEGLEGTSELTEHMGSRSRKGTRRHYDEYWGLSRSVPSCQQYC